jgi:ATP-independent RNA helicase DbpA
MKKFTQLPLPEAMQKNLKDLGFDTMRPVQEEAIPPALEGKDLIVQAQTGSGKTLAFGIPLLIDVSIERQEPSALVIAPTRELCMQITEVLRKLARFLPNTKIVSLYGGVAMRREIDSLKKGAHIVVATPGRLLDHLGKGTLDLTQIKRVVLDEADRMLDMGFFDEVEKILSHTPKDRQILLFSATYPPKVVALAKAFMRNPKEIKIASESTKPDIEEHFFKASDKNSALLRILSHYRPDSAIVFATTKEKVKELTAFLRQRGYDALDLQGDLDQHERNERLIRFANRSAVILVATDLAARGLDVADVDMVINYEMPQIDEHYTHRIGRTGRAGKSGIAVSLVAASDSGAEPIDSLEISDTTPLKAVMETIVIGGGKRDKLRPGDIVGALTGEMGVANEKIGKIDLLDRISYVAVEREEAKKRLSEIKRLRIKKKQFKRL